MQDKSLIIKEKENKKKIKKKKKRKNIGLVPEKIEALLDEYNEVQEEEEIEEEIIEDKEELKGFLADIQDSIVRSYK